MAVSFSSESPSLVRDDSQPSNPSKESLSIVVKKNVRRRKRRKKPFEKGAHKKPERAGKHEKRTQLFRASVLIGFSALSSPHALFDDILSLMSLKYLVFQPQAKILQVQMEGCERGGLRPSLLQ